MIEGVERLRELKRIPRNVRWFAGRYGAVDRHACPGSCQKGELLMIRRLFVSAVLVCAIALVVQSIPDIARYMKIREM